MARDAYLRTPRSGAAQYGLKDVCRVLLEHLAWWQLVDARVLLASVRVWGDHEGLAPLHLAVIGKHPETCAALVQHTGQPLTSPNLFLLAARLRFQEIVRDLVLAKVVGLDYTDAENNYETALYIAAKQDFALLVESLLLQHADPELGECVFGWTPVFAAAAEGYADCVRLLVDPGAQNSMTDYSGWLPMEYASLRGHLHVADMLVPDSAAVLLYNMKEPVRNVPRVPNALSRKESAGDDALLLTSSIDKLPEQNRLAVSEVYRQLKQLDSTSSVNAGGD